ncbi:hypothetical protein [Fictibacillus sp. 18YEL24]|uniref:hypothetical protein n=1 Tax=Fictibacillus sp. 18YEL24 TaxID=2745875 RepID=UPI0018CC8E59|nr:hypothetical protein [Fictibacillus sp. 18YEL24]MBH0171007.1 hypothetical protein [Fictibacillus sp. 18YEL24]
MTLIAALPLGINYDIKTILIAGDSRIVDLNEKGRYRNHTDTGQKLFNLAPNIITGFAGDYILASKAITEINKILKKKVASQPIYSLRIDIVMSRIRVVMKEVWPEGDKSTSFLFAVHDSFDNRRKLYVSHSPEFKMERLSANNKPYLIGSDDVTRITFTHHYETYTKKNLPRSKEEFGNHIMMAMGKVLSLEINGIFSCYCLDYDGNYTIHHGYMPIEEAKWIFDTEGKDGWERKVDQKTILKTSKLSSEVLDDLRRGKRK